MSEKELVTSKDLGINLFDFVMLSSQRFLKGGFVSNMLKGVNVSHDNLYDIEIVIAYMWLVFHLLNMKGKKYEYVAAEMHTKFLDVFKIPESERPQTMDLLGKRYEEYKEVFQKRKLNFEEVALSISIHCLKDIKQAAFFHFELSVNLTNSFKALLKILNNIEIKDS
jgi:hypothetical protein